MTTLTLILVIAGILLTIAASAFFCGSIPVLGRKRLYCWEIRVALFFS